MLKQVGLIQDKSVLAGAWSGPGVEPLVLAWPLRERFNTIGQ